MRTIFSRLAIHSVLTISVFSAAVGCGSSDSYSYEPFGGTSGASPLAPGSLDPSFGSGGVVTSSNISPAAALNVALQADGKIVVVTPLSNSTEAAQVFGVVRYQSNGALDTTFGNQGVARTAFTVGFSVPTSVTATPDGKIVVVGSASSPDNSTSMFAVARYRSNGTLDPTFGTAGRVTTPLLGRRDVANVVLLQTDGKILVGGRALTAFGTAGVQHTALVRYLADGRLDGTFGMGGKVVADLAGSVGALAIAQDGSILALGDRDDEAVAVRVSSTGSVLSLTLAGSISPIAVTGNATFQPDGAFVAASTVRGRSRFDVDVRLQRFSLGGELDTAFNPIFDFASPGIANRPNAAQALLAQTDGKILAGGIAGVAAGVSAFGLARFNTDGTFDTTFGTKGIVTTRFSGRSDQIYALARQPDGKIVAVGLTISASTGATAIALARYFGQ